MALAATQWVISSLYKECRLTVRSSGPGNDVAALCAPWTACAGQGGVGSSARPLNLVVREHMGTTVTDGLGLITWGLVLACAGLLLLGEYRKVFFQNPRALMTFEMWAQVFAHAGGPGYLASMLLVCAAFFLVGGMATLVMVGLLAFVWRPGAL